MSSTPTTPPPDEPDEPDGELREAAESPPGPQPEASSEEDPAALAERLKAQVAELEDVGRRALADADNLRKRFEREADRERRRERARVAARWLPVLDNLERALQHAEADPGLILDGVRAVRDQAVEVLAELGYPRRDEVGVPFDPALHEAVSVMMDTDAIPGTVVRVLQPGYGDGEHQLRPALVSVAAKAGQ
ncbi:nucleotide exchange factor GrpE [Nonomuraea africana]|uniref:Protein GrpE n=1 Tax=Nonomuraea africana TaxID=46171 RepID=A0ABR9KAZ8_9ACTN|nr:nucleotide exchange factor GrpE [Nonomuraea africana]MBE1559191.1 molecular chaperone GrpE [Nonomuraea africana]